jgi:hypothetical protein
MMKKTGWVLFFAALLLLPQLGMAKAKTSGTRSASGEFR